MPRALHIVQGLSAAGCFFQGVLGVHLSSKHGTVWYQKEGTIVGV